MWEMSLSHLYSLHVNGALLAVEPPEDHNLGHQVGPAHVQEEPTIVSHKICFKRIFIQNLLFLYV